REMNSVADGERKLLISKSEMHELDARLHGHDDATTVVGAHPALQCAHFHRGVAARPASIRAGFASTHLAGRPWRGRGHRIIDLWQDRWLALRERFLIVD
ncbi:MAG: hypothetical protein KDI75_10830, partial [Xanthomonadales bacterium]|nr:hypothetical protein [Xanthomonadales bacterium]